MILILGGTTEGRMAVRVADEAATPYFYSTKGHAQVIECAHGTRLTGAMDLDAMTRFCQDNKIRLLIDAAHPFAQVLHQTIFETSQRLQIPVVRLERRYPPRDENLIWCDSYADAILQMEKRDVKRLLALSGVNTMLPLRPFWEQHPCWFRILDRSESTSLAEKLGFPTDRLVFYQEGEDEYQLLRQLCPDAILTKESGFSGYFTEKVNAAQSFGIPVFVVKRPKLPETFYLVYGEDGLRKMIERLLPDFFPLKSGYTTGACATAAAKAALLALLSKQPQTTSEIALPSGELITLPVDSTAWNDNSASCSVVKDAGDDPDVTNHCRILATVRLWKDDSKPESKNRIHFEGGIGVGRVTLPGLGLEIGGPAINATPRKMMCHELLPLLPSPEYCATITISVPGGEEIAQRTFNPKLGIVGGISIIGTSGIVRPFSSDAFIASIRKEANVAKAIGCDTLVINSGAKSEQYLKGNFPDFPAQAFVHYGNFIGETLKIAHELQFPNVILGIMLGKAVKLADGHLDTHSKKVVMNRIFLQGIAQQTKCELSHVEAIGNLNLARQLWKILSAEEQDRFFPRLLERCKFHCQPFLPQANLTICLISEDGELRYSI